MCGTGLDGPGIGEGPVPRQGIVFQQGTTDHVTGREQEIIDCVCQGLSNSEIARRLTLSPNTVKTHLNTIFKKLNITSRSKLMTLAAHRPREVSV